MSDKARRVPARRLVLRDAYDMRIVLTHEYFRVAPNVVWNTVRNDLPTLDALVESLLA